MTKVAWSSDIHLDHVDELVFNKFVKSINDLKVDELWLTGDISNGLLLEDHLISLSNGLNYNIDVLFVLGNHDFYSSNLHASIEISKRLDRNYKNLAYMPECQIGTDAYSIVCVNGWGDGRYGNGNSKVCQLNDWFHISNFVKKAAHLHRPTLLDMLYKLGKQEAKVLKRNLDVLNLSEKPAGHVVHVLTHVPPFEGAQFSPDGSFGDPDFSPWFACKATGGVLERYAKKFPDIQFKVYAGHFHTAGTYQHLDNLFCETAGAKYGAPSVYKVFEI